MGEAYIKLYKKLLAWEWYDNPNTMRLFIHCLLKANWQEARWHGEILQPGQFVTSLASLSEETGLSIKQVRVALKHLETTGEVASKGQSKYRIITVNNWGCYQAEGKQRANKGQTKGKQRATVEEIKEIKNINKYYDNEKLNKAFNDFIAMRKDIKKPMSDRAIELAISKLDKLSGGDTEVAIEIVNQSILNGWQGFYELKEKKSIKPKDNARKYSAEDWAAMERDALKEGYT